MTSIAASSIEIPGSTNLDLLAYTLSSVDPLTKEMNSDYKAFPTPAPTSDFSSIAFEYQLPTVHYPEPESSDDLQELNFSIEEQVALSLPHNDTGELDLSWIDRWKADHVFMLVEKEEEVHGGHGIIDSEKDEGETGVPNGYREGEDQSGDLNVDGEENDESDTSDVDGWFPEEREWVSVILTL